MTDEFVHLSKYITRHPFYLFYCWKWSQKMGQGQKNVSIIKRQNVPNFSYWRKWLKLSIRDLHDSHSCSFVSFIDHYFDWIKNEEDFLLEFINIFFHSLYSSFFFLLNSIQWPTIIHPILSLSLSPSLYVGI